MAFDAMLMLCCCRLVLPTGCAGGQGLANGTCTPCTGNTVSLGGANATCTVCGANTLPNEARAECAAGESVQTWRADALMKSSQQL
jgi:hypothetical protein